MADSPPGDSRLSFIVTLIIGAVVIFGIGSAISKAWLSDDAFISFRYAKNLSDGAGLVYNIGERVEGYTNFLWTTILAGGMRLGITPEVLSQALGIMSFALLAGLLFWHSYNRRKSRKPLQSVFLPLAALSLLLNRDMQVFATSGLETAFFTMLIFAAYETLVWRESRSAYLIGGLLLTCASLTRPDGLILYATAVVFVQLFSASPVAERTRAAIAMLLPGLIIYVPYFLLRWQYYGQFFPNTYYAKSASLPYYSQGLIYLWLFVKTYYIFFTIPLILFGALALALSHRLHNSTHPKAPLLTTGQTGATLPRMLPRTPYRTLFALALALIYMFSVVRVGGDFMFARFFIPIIPLLYIAIEETIAGVHLSANVKYALAALALLTVVLRNNQFSTPGQSIAGIADESQYYSSAFVAHQRQLGLSASKAIRESGAIVSFKGANAMLVYYVNPEIAIEAESGLTDSALAHQTLLVRGRPGHEKGASLAYLQERKVNIQFACGLDFEKTQDEMHYLQIGGLIAYLVGYENDVMDALAQNPDVKFMDFPKYLDTYLDNINSKPASQVLQDYKEFKSFYFNYNSDSARENRFLQMLHPDELQTSPPGSPDISP